ncbi:alpha-glucosidase/alpha-galactosidase [Magnetospirillum moscoviense]|uniref:Alpha-glucosidase/alpha-galactosidase n=1 Tax=Magnetospirillum moscoviense TaxID=1437059 RepID=A0A178MJX0_9PROT|nr:alpha-glucosidase/alpha-galactosidase [Magnetospirillum moscoviense]OAN48976.1 alpha-glucosidase/alpha-galactosidase [Magnetospirillum moscoviense]
MTNNARIVFIGAGSMSFGLSTFRDIFNTKSLAGCTMVLVDTNPEALERMTALARIMNREGGAGLTIESTTDRRAALAGAGFVINSVAIDRNRLWKMDFEIPRKHGIRQTLGENGGPGGLFFTMRTLPLIFDIVRDMEELCPDALLINYANPESRIVLALAKYSKIKCLGLCHGIFMARGDICHMMDRSWFDLELWGAGLNHFQWVLGMRDRHTGEDLYPRFREIEKTFDPAFQPLSRRLMNSFGYWPTCSDDHLGEYVPYGWEGGEHGYDFAADERERAELKTTIEGVLAGGPLPDEWRHGPAERSDQVIEAILHNSHRYLESAVLHNRGAIPNLPADLAVEVPAIVDSAGVHPVSLGPLPDPIAKLLSVQASVQQLAVEAAVHASKELALQALLVDPVVNSTTAAQALLDELWEINRPYIRPCV